MGGPSLFFSSHSNGAKNDRLRTVRKQLAAATAAPKCHGCGCFQRTVDALDGSEAGRAHFGKELGRAGAVFVPKQYDCLGCAVCYPAIAANAFAEAFPELIEALDLCPAEEPAERSGWPPLPGDYHVVRYGAPVAVCTLNSAELVAQLTELRPEGLSIAGTMHTENLGIERVIRNLLANPHIRFLVVCGEDARQAVGHLPGQSLMSLFESGLDERGRIRGAQGKRPYLKNVSREEVEAFLRQVEPVGRLGEVDHARIARAVEACARRDPGPFEAAAGFRRVETVRAREPQRLILDPAGFFVVYPDPPRQRLVLEHYTKDGLLDSVVEGASSKEVWLEAIERKLLSRLDHAAYLGHELARAERSMRTGEPYVQDRAPGEVAEVHREAWSDTPEVNMQPTLDAQRRHWDAAFGANPEMFGSAPSDPARKAAEVLRAHGKMSLLELGCGQGRDSLFFARHGSHVTALDYSQVAIDNLANEAASADLTPFVTACRHDVREPLPFEANSFDASFSHMLFCMVLTSAELERLAEEIRGVLRPGGLNVYTVRHTGDPHYRTGIHRGEDMYEVGGFIVHFFSLEKVHALARGYEILSIDSFEEGGLPRKLYRVTLRKAG